MPMTVKVGLAKKVGQPDFGSLGASCDIALELDGSLLFQDLEGFQEKIRAAYVACRQAVNDELANQTRGCESASAEKPACTSFQPSHNNTSRTNPQSNGHTPNGNGKRRAATTSQVRALHAIATRQGFNLTDRLKDQFNLYRAEDLSISEASRLIDHLNAPPVTSGTNGSGGHQ